jgi:hypothetical protein
MAALLAEEVRRSQNHLAEPTLGPLMDSAAIHHRFQVVEDEIHGLVAPREDRMANDSLDTFDNRGFDVHGVCPVMSNDVELSYVLSIALASRIPNQPVKRRRIGRVVIGSRLYNAIPVSTILGPSSRHISPNWSCGCRQ